MAEWIECSIGDLCSTISDTYKGNDEYVVLVNTSDVLEGKVLNHETVANKNLKGQFKKTFKRDDILYSEIRPANKRFAYIDFENTSNYIASTKLMVLRHNEKVLPEYLFALLKSNYVIAELQHLAETRSGTFPQITFSSELAPMKVFLPDKDTQKRIVSILSSIEQKIDKNTEINNNLEQQADALYQSFFSPKSGTQGKLVTLDEYCSIFTGKKNANASVDGGKYKFFTCAPEALQIDSYIYDGNAIIVSGNGAYTGRTRFYSGKFDLYQRTYACTLLNNVNPEFIFPLYWFVKLELSKKIMGGTRGSAIPYIVMNDLAKFEFIYNEQTFTEYMPIFKSLTEAIQANEFENENLAQIRDSLLPKLMSGELDVSDIDF